MKNIFTHTLIIIFSLSHFLSFSQRLPAKQWYIPGADYCKITVAETGLYEVTGTELINAGIPANQIHSDSLRLFRLGDEVPIAVIPSSDKLLGPEGRIRFNGIKNDGASETSLYTSPGAQPHTHYSLYSDSAAYFLTWNNVDIKGKRMEFGKPEHDTATIHYHEFLHVFHSHYNTGPFYPEGAGFSDGSVKTAYDQGEGWTGPPLKKGEIYEISLNPDILHFDTAKLEMVLTGWTNEVHEYGIWTGKKENLRLLGNVVFNGFSSKKFISNLSANDLHADGTCTIKLNPEGDGGGISVGYAKMIYPQKQPRQPHIPICTTAPKIEAGRFHSLDDRKIEYLIITHPKMRKKINGIDPVEAYAAYRSSAAGGGYETEIVSIFDINNTFNYGQRGPQGIRNMIASLRQKHHLKFVLLIGKSVDPQKVRKHTAPSDSDLIPNAGWPGSDNALVTLPDNGFVPVVPIGRINASYPEEVMHYLHKVMALESEPAAAGWRKRVLHLSGGRSRDEILLFKSYVHSFAQKLQKSNLGAAITTRSKTSDAPVEELDVSEHVNTGVALVTMFGHSGVTSTDIYLGNASDTSIYQNHPFYPAVIVNGCAAGSIFYSNQALSNDWILASKSGAALFLAHTFNGSSTALKKLTETIYEVIGDSAFTSSPFGTVQQEAIRRVMNRNPDQTDSITVQQMILHGDPAIRIFPAKLPDYAIDSSDLNHLTHSSKDTLQLRLVVRNLGRYRKENYTLQINRRIGRVTTDSLQFVRPAPPVADTIYFTMPHPAKEELWQVIVDPQNALSEESEKNNDFQVKSGNIQETEIGDGTDELVMMVTIDEKIISNLDFVDPQPVIGIHLAGESIAAFSDTLGITVWLKKQCDGCVERRIFLSNARQTMTANLFSLAFTTPEPLSSGIYKLTVQLTKAGFETSYAIAFCISGEEGIVEISAFPNPSCELVTFSIECKKMAPGTDMDLSVYDLNGREVYRATRRVVTGRNDWIWRPVHITAGIYQYRFTASEPWRIKPECREGMQGRLLLLP